MRIEYFLAKKVEHSLYVTISDEAKEFINEMYQKIFQMNENNGTPNLVLTEQYVFVNVENKKELDKNKELLSVFKQYYHDKDTNDIIYVNYSNAISGTSELRPNVIDDYFNNNQTNQILQSYKNKLQIIRIVMSLGQDFAFKLHRDYCCKSIAKEYALNPNMVRIEMKSNNFNYIDPLISDSYATIENQQFIRRQELFESLNTAYPAHRKERFIVK